MMLFQRKPESEVRDAIREFACKYGLLGIMTALPTTAKFIDYEKVYPAGYPMERYRPYNGVYQQYMFFYYRDCSAAAKQ